jgi:hypothetical protein
LGTTDYGVGVQGTGKFAVQGTSAASAGYGVQGINTSNVSTSIAVFGQSQDGSGFDGPGIGVQGQTGGGIGVVELTTGFGTGVLGSSGDPFHYGVHGVNGDGSSGSVAILGKSLGTGNGTGVEGASTSGDGVVGTSNSGRGGVFGSTSFLGVDASSFTGIAVRAQSQSGDGLDGITVGSSALGVWGINASNNASSVALKETSQNGSGGLGPGIGVVGETASGTGVYGTATTGVAVYGTTAGGGATQAIYGVGTSGSTGLRATSDSGNGMVALSTSGTGLNVQSSS